MIHYAAEPLGMRPLPRELRPCAGHADVLVRIEREARNQVGKEKADFTRKQDKILVSKPRDENEPETSISSVHYFCHVDQFFHARKQPDADRRLDHH
jgi:hypothetical protein